MPSIRHDDVLLRLIRDVNDIRSALRRVVANLPLYDIANENTPTQLTANQNNYVPGNYDILRISGDAIRTITGMSGGVKGRFVKIFNTGSYPLVLSHQSSSSLAANRFKFATSVDTIVMPGSSVVVYYDSTQLRWIEGVQLEGSGLSKENTPSQITADQNNYIVGGYEVIRLSSDALRNITGIAEGSKGRRITLKNVGSFSIVLKHESVLSSAANRITVSTGSDFTLISNGSIDLYYDITTTRWLIDDGSGVLWRRQGGSSSVWFSQGTNNYTPTNAIMQGGVARIVFVAAAAAFVAVTFPVAFSQSPIILLTTPYQGAVINDMGYQGITASTFNIYMQFNAPVTVNIDVTWLAIGPR